jgi:uncharacterized membrane protein
MGLKLFFLRKYSIYLLVLLIVAIVLNGLFTGCASENEETLFPPPTTCDTTSVQYAKRVQPILAQNCYRCHNTQNAPTSGAGIVLEGYDNLKIWVESNRILGSIKHEAGFSPMPKNTAQLSACDIQIIQMWIAKGAKND